MRLWLHRILYQQRKYLSYRLNLNSEEKNNRVCMIIILLLSLIKTYS